MCLANCPHNYSKDAAPQGWTESIYRCLLAAAIWSMHDLGAQPTTSSNKLHAGFAEGGKLEYPETNPRSRVENQHKLSPHKNGHLETMTSLLLLNHAPFIFLSIFLI